MKRPLDTTNYSLNVAPDTHSGILNNSFKTTEGEIKVMFWNIKNLYEHGILTKEEYELKGDPSLIKDKKSETVSTDDAIKPMTIAQKNVNKHMKLMVEGEIEIKDEKQKKVQGKTIKKEFNRREWIARIINECDADIVVIAEPAIGKSIFNKRINNPQFLEHNLAAVKSKSPFLCVDIGGGSWGPEQIQIDLNKLFDVEGNPWCSAISAINSTEIEFEIITEKPKVPNAKAKESLKGKSKNSMFEMYGLLWRKDRISIGTKAPHEVIKVVNLDKTDNAVEFIERAPGHIEFFSLKDNSKCFDLFCLHNLFGGKLGEAEKREKRGASIENIKKLKAFNADEPTVVIGDFNLDMGNHLEKGKYDTLSKIMEQRIFGQKSSIAEKTNTLASEYEHAFTTKLGKKDQNDKIIDIAVKYFSGSYATAFKISDHLPMIITLRSEKFLKKGPVSDTVTIATGKKMKRIKCDDLEKLHLSPGDSIFLSAVRGINLIKGHDNKKESQQSFELLQNIRKLLMAADEDSQLAMTVFDRIDELYDVALQTEPDKEYNHPNQWFFNTDDPEDYHAAKQVAVLVCKGYELEEAMEIECSEYPEYFYNTVYDLVWNAMNDKNNCRHWRVSQNVKSVPGVGPNLLREFKKPEPSYNECYVAYCNDFNVSGIQSSYVEAHAISILYACPVYIVSIDDSGKVITENYTPQVTLYSKGIGRPLWFLYIGSRYDCLFDESLKTTM